MLFRSNKQMSRLKKKLLLYFILVAIVSISVSAEIILEFSTTNLTDQIVERVYLKVENSIPANIPEDQRQMILNSINAEIVEREIADDERQRILEEGIFVPLYQYRNRMILLLLVISLCIFAAFFMFTKDIVSPMDGMVEATKRIADGDLTVTVPIQSEDEIGQIGGLINNMNTNLQDMIMQIRQEINRHMEQIIKASFKIGEIINSNMTDEVIETKKMRVSDFRRILDFGKDVILILETMSEELFALQKFVNMYKTYQVQSEVTQDEIEQAIDKIQKGSDDIS